LLPKLNKAVTLKEFLQNNKEGIQLIAHCEETDKNIEISFAKNQNTTILIGPEGDFSEKRFNGIRNTYYQLHW
jgi:16S rRNA (uracil1498-N3)-methyltransferase